MTQTFLICNPGRNYKSLSIGGGPGTEAFPAGKSPRTLYDIFAMIIMTSPIIHLLAVLPDTILI
ncbi:4692_t:CDS:2 [Funneliformis geosporum]|nr:4692_t:CDS:2 [Funneliformis geosporum]